MLEHRKSRRRGTHHVIPVINAITGEPVGQIGNLSVDGMLLITHRRLREDALFQFAFELPGPQGTPHRVELGMHEQWSDPAGIPGHFWSGLRIIAIETDDRAVLTAWVERREDGT
jgi:hypothetical protein